MNRVPIRGYEGLYEVDDYGNVYSLIQNTSRRKIKRIFSERIYKSEFI